MVFELFIEEYMFFDCLMGVLLIGEVVVLFCKYFINVMEELVLFEAIVWVVEIEVSSNKIFDVGDIVVYVLNRFFFLYVIIEEGV